MSEPQKSRVTDTFPKKGRVTEVCKEWLVHEDGALAYKLQKEEVEQHYSGNKTRNALVREDFPRAKDEQLREELEARLKYQQIISQQEEEDARVARLLAERIQKEEQRRMKLASEDEELARQFHKQEKLKVLDKENSSNCRSSHPGASLTSDANDIALPLDGDDSSSVNYLLHTLQNRKSKGSNSSTYQDDSFHYRSNSNDDSLIVTDLYDLAKEDVEHVLSDRELEEEVIRRLQEQKDEELAQLLQQEEAAVNSQSLIAKDRLLAIEAQDKELAKLLQEREKAKLKRARERAKQKALLKKQQELELEKESINSESSSNLVVDSCGEKLSRMKMSSSHSFDESNKNSIGKSQSPIKSQVSDSDALKIMSSKSATNFQGMQNIAIAIDPTYSVQKPNQKPNFHESLPPEVLNPVFDEDEINDDGSLGSSMYVPVQGQRRTASLEKKSKKHKNKEGCTQQ